MAFRISFHICVKGGPFIHCCYRDTKMEIQGLSDAQNIHYQHGAPRRTASSPFKKKTGTFPRFVSNDSEADEGLESQGLQSDNNNNRTRTSPFCLLAENGSGVCLPVCRQNGNVKNNCPLQAQAENVGHRNVNNLKGRELNALSTQDLLRTVYKYDVESGDSILQMALPFFEGEDEHSQHPQPPVLRQRHEDGASLLQSLASENTAACGSNSTASANKNTEELFVVFNIVQEDGNDLNRERAGHSFKDGDTIIGKKLEHCKSNPCNSMEVQNNDVLIESDENLNNFASGGLSRTAHLCSLLNSNSSSNGEVEATLTDDNKSMCYEAQSENAALTNEYGENICRHQVCIENIDSQGPNQYRAQTEAKHSAASTSENTDIMEINDPMDFISDACTSLPPSDRASNNVSSNETFSGTIMINNQSIIVTIENGVLTLAAPPEGYPHKDDGMVGLKEHLGMKDHEDIVLLNYDSGTKSIGKISNVAVIRAGHHEEPRLSLSVSDSELALADDCSLSELGVSFDSCPVIKQENGTPCALRVSDLGSQRPDGSAIDCDDEDFQAVGFVGASGLSKKGALVTSYPCPQPGCPGAFDTRQKLKMHLLNHTEDQRPFRCTFEGCGWAFTTSYKLKRHLQSHDKVRPHKCEWEGCGRRFTTVYNLKAHVKQHDQENAFVCEICSERFRSATRLTNHQRAHFEPERPHKCEFPGCEKTFITYSALFSHNRTHFRETGQFTCTYPGCDKRYDKACRLKIHMRSHTGERPFICDSAACGWSFTSMSKLLRHKRKHDDDRRFTCPEEGCGKSFTRAEHLKGHSITHLGTKPFECHVDGCSAKFSARSSLYIHSKKHKQDAGSLRAQCLVTSCSKHFSSRSSLKSHMLKHHHLSPDVLSQLEATPTLTPSSELVSGTVSAGTCPGPSGGDQLANLDLSSLLSAGPTVQRLRVPVGGAGQTGTFTMDLSLVNSGILTIDPASVSTALSTSLAKGPADPLALAAGSDTGHLRGAVGCVVPLRGALNLDGVPTVSPDALGSLGALTVQTAASAADHLALSSSGATSSLAGAPGLLASPAEVSESGGGRVGSGQRLGGVEELGQQDGGKVLTQFVFPGHRSPFSPQKDPKLGHASAFPNPFKESSGSARTDYRAIQLAKKRKQRAPSSCSGSSGLSQRKSKGGISSSAASPLAATRFGDGSAAANAGLTIRDPVTGAQYVQIQLLQDDPASDGDLAFQLSSQPSSSHSQLTVDLPVNILQEPPVMAEDDNGSDNSQFTGSTINLQDLE
ncbi:zinc finger protein ZXDC [Esox lucius]|uniref:C2H2-type domain-containing protein n=1 Tax=Esox lucius TaxID=8010 RepID=A0A3P9A060_ESOLU|nr:zinc finger protein ZXDC [Esox lucius]